MSRADSTPLVSVVTIFLNAARYIEEAIESVLGQSYSNWELLLVDDGSTDESSGIARDFVRRRPEQIRYMHHPGRVNRGMSASRNLGISSARGELIALLDADDVYLAHKLQHQVTLLQRHPYADWIYGTTEYWYSWTGRDEDALRDRIRRPNIPVSALITPPQLFKLFIDGQARTPATCGVLMRRESVQGVGGFEEQFPGIDEDQIFFLKLGLHTSAYIDGTCCDRYRQRPDSTVQTSLQSGDWRPGIRSSPARQRYVDWLEQYLVKHGVDDLQIWRTVARLKRPLRYPRLFDILAALSDLREGVVVRVRRVGTILSRWKPPSKT